MLEETSQPKKVELLVKVEDVAVLATTIKLNVPTHDILSNVLQGLGKGILSDYTY